LNQFCVVFSAYFVIVSCCAAAYGAYFIAYQSSLAVLAYQSSLAVLLPTLAYQSSLAVLLSYKLLLK